MRQARLIKETEPCDTDFTDKSIQTVADAKTKGRVRCSNFEQCEKRSSAETIQCTRRVAQQMAGYIIAREGSFENAVREEVDDLIKYGKDGKFWVCDEEGNWEVVKGKKNVIDTIKNFAFTIIDKNESERRPFTQDGKKVPEMGP